MKKLATLLLAAGLLYAVPGTAQAIDFKAKGQWVMNFDFGQNGLFTQNGQTGYNRNYDDFEAGQRIRLQVDAAASESLSGTVYFEIGNQGWGKDAQGGELGADRPVVELKNAYIDWIVPQTDLKVRMGLQLMALPGFSASSQILYGDVAGVTASYQFTENVGLTAFWARPYNDNYTASAENMNRSNYLDNMDLMGITVPLVFEGVKVTPWALYGMIGPNTFRSGNDYFSNTSNSYFKNGLVALGGGKRTKMSNYGNIWWAGLTGEVTAFDPFRLAWDFNYGSVRYDDASASRAGWLASLLFEYKLDWGIPGIYGWYGSGDDSDVGNGSERMPYTNLDDGGINSFATYAFNGGRANTMRDSLLGHSMSGTWGIGARLKDMSFVEKLKHSLRVNYISGTNDPALLKKINRRGGIDDIYGVHQNWMAPNAAVLGKENMYLTRNDSAVEVGLLNEYAMYDNFKVYLGLSYIVLWLDHSDSVWGLSKMNGKSDSAADSWNVDVTFVYSF